MGCRCNINHTLKKAESYLRNGMSLCFFFYAFFFFSHLDITVLSESHEACTPLFFGYAIGIKNERRADSMAAAEKREVNFHEI